VVDGSGQVSFAAHTYRVGNPYRRLQVEVAIVNNTVQISYEGAVVKTLNRPGFHDCSGYWATASAAALV
jgi:hypothetical protein